MIKRLILGVTALLLCVSCAPKEKIVYYNAGAQESNSSYESRIKSDDLLMITVLSPDNDAATLPFNLQASYALSTGSGQNVNPQLLEYQSYLVDKKGEIEFPIIGTLKLGGLTKAEAVDKLKQEVKRYVNNPIINLRILNYRISVTGEVLRPGTFTVNSERISLPEALALAGDMTIYGDRKNIKIIRDIEGVKTIHKVDITNTSFMNSDLYYLSQNDVIYVEPNKTKVNSSAVGPNITVGLTALSLLITVAALILR
ncbi:MULTISPECIES: polysaccharide biosynthesis/export family protein [unclassified Flavobacterium]|uniref:polysaccharide biosynthesis/export family protein n=1 Tax=unclassified Flavobacterium TaxID=196869 RepID=UPI001F130938|nr:MULTISPECIES: polysaccharide biosynthesis/export family protein [unclassified Flavobacterium]UMY65819.1 polysaccharide biosynthesis/export family protein [Flavobacterium sp. HJ-32-4]